MIESHIIIVETNKCDNKKITNVHWCLCSLLFARDSPVNESIYVNKIASKGFSVVFKMATTYLFTQSKLEFSDFRNIYFEPSIICLCWLEPETFYFMHFNDLRFKKALLTNVRIHLCQHRVNIDGIVHNSYIGIYTVGGSRPVWWYIQQGSIQFNFQYSFIYISTVQFPPCEFTKYTIFLYPSI